MLDYWLGLVGVGCLLWVLRIPITFHLFSKLGEICLRLGWDEPLWFFAKEVNLCFYYHPEWFPRRVKAFTQEELEEWRREVANANNLEDIYP